MIFIFSAVIFQKFDNERHEISLAGLLILPETSSTPRGADFIADLGFSQTPTF